MNKVYTAQEVADKLKIKKSTVYDLIKRGELSSSKVGKQLRVSEEQLSQYLKGSECSASSAQSYDHQPESSTFEKGLSSAFQWTDHQRTGFSGSGSSPKSASHTPGQSAGSAVSHEHLQRTVFSLF